VMVKQINENKMETTKRGPQDGRCDGTAPTGEDRRRRSGRGRAGGGRGDHRRAYEACSEGACTGFVLCRAHEWNGTTRPIRGPTEKEVDVPGGRSGVLGIGHPHRAEDPELHLAHHLGNSVLAKGARGAPVGYSQDTEHAPASRGSEQGRKS